MNKILHWIIISIAIMGYIACGDLIKNINPALNGIIPNKTIIKDGEYQNKGFSKIILQEGVTSIGRSAFKGNKLKKVTIPRSVKSVEEKAFVGNPLEKVILSRSLYNQLRGKIDKVFGTQAIIYLDFDGNKLNDNGNKLNDDGNKLTSQSELSTTREVKDLPSASNLKEASIQLASKFYAAAIKGSEKNVLISPYGLKSVLAMTALALSEENEKELVRAIFLNPDEDYLKAVSDQIKTLNSEVLKSANRMWVDDDLALNKETMNHIGKYFDSTIIQLDLGDAADAKKRINDTLAELTNNKITDFFKSIDPLTKAILANALYFSANWKYAFEQAKKDQWKNHDKTDTADIKFYNSVAKRDVPIPIKSIMHIETLTNNIPYFIMVAGNEITNEAGKAIKASVEVASIPYKDEKTSMIIILPGTSGGVSKNFSNLEENIQELLPNILTELDTRTSRDGSLIPGITKIVMPKFKTEWDGSLMDMLEDLDMDFLKSVSFNRLSDSGSAITIGDIKQKTFIELTLTGTTAASATVIDARARSGDIPERPEAMLLNRSFLYLIRDNETSAVLFMGRFLSPSP